MTTSFYATCEGQVISWFVQKHDPIQAICLKVLSENDKDDFQSDYHAGAYYDTIKSANQSFTWNIQKGENQ